MVLRKLKSRYLISVLPDVIDCLGLGVGFVFTWKNLNFTTCVNYSNSVCELLILKLHTPSLIVILMYKPPSCTINEFDDIIIKINQFIFSLNSPLPNIMIYVLSQQVHRPTRKSNILDLIFCPNKLINSIVVSDTFISDHRIITVETNLPVHGVAPKQILNLPSNQFIVFWFSQSWLAQYFVVTSIYWLGSHSWTNSTIFLFLLFHWHFIS